MQSPPRRVPQAPGGNGTGHGSSESLAAQECAFGYPREFLQNRYVYFVISPRARGLSIGVNVNPVVNCNFCCRYCEVSREKPPRSSRFDVALMTSELQQMLCLANEGRLRDLPQYANLPADLMELKHVAISGDGEPTLAKDFVETFAAVVHLRALGRVPFFKIVLLTNSTSLEKPEVQEGLSILVRSDEIWAKLDGGTDAYLESINGSKMPIRSVLSNILSVARRRPVIIQSLFAAIDGAEPPETEVEEYAKRLKELKDDGAEIPLVQVYSATRPMARKGCTHLPLKTLSSIARKVREVAGLRAEVF